MMKIGVHLLVVTLLALQARAVPISSFFTYEGDSVVPRRLAASSHLQLANTFRYNGQEFSSVYVSVDLYINVASQFCILAEMLAPCIDRPKGGMTWKSELACILFDALGLIFLMV